MQDIQAVVGFSGGDRRMRPHNHPNNHLQALKCPRCDSLNTKFCYFNNYNMSQPRHFCKSCRRYWTKGGVLRNVPIGGGCRKSKQANQKSGVRERILKAQSSSSTDSSNLTVPPPTSSATGEEASAATNKASISALGYNFPDSPFFNSNPSFDNQQPLVNNPSDGQIFPQEISGYGRILPPGSSEMMVFNTTAVQCRTTSYSRVPEVFNDPTLENPRLPLTEEIKITEIEGGINCSDLAAAPEWVSNGEGEEHGLFDLTAAVDPAYWSQSPWTDNDQSCLNFLP